MSTILRFLGVFIALNLIAQSFVLWSGFAMESVTFIMWTVGLAAIITLKWEGKGLGDLGWQWGEGRYHWIALGLPFIYGTIAYSLAGMMGWAQFATPDMQAAFRADGPLANWDSAVALLPTVLIVFAAGVANSFARALGEEIGWRGFLTPRLTQAWGFALATLVTGLFWGVWHFPALLFSEYNAGGNPIWEMISFLVLVVSLSAPMAWLRLKSGSLWPAATFHAAHNVFIQRILDPMAARNEGDITMVSEFGIVLAIVAALVAAPFWFWGIQSFRKGGTA
ncbi:CPBP family intramembrane glutamic endopeptidase [Hyphobacterium sp. HN65]|uniref:CPBP family intramembrane glutamic endopeptidase n=1 Tax=Hyphobacterium lacteum TaxID=3116575 RepID=A0ABU7LM13_9PROT|nr:CPBP family intramembrane glutamic endopeptidase [Hyphobacterium sp. HN65]MEE2524922.1 CPBP family intramembrane glutamic endopeptidase [Hyphobacterium sp. HN65]